MHKKIFWIIFGTLSRLSRRGDFLVEKHDFKHRKEDIKGQKVGDICLAPGLVFEHHQEAINQGRKKLYNQ